MVYQDQGCEKSVFFQKNQPTCFFWVFYIKNVFWVFLKRKNILFFFQGKQKNPIQNCFYFIIQYHHFQNYTMITCYTLLWHSKLRVKKSTHLCFRKVLLVSSLQRLGKHAPSKQRKNIPTQTLQFHVKFMCMPCLFSICRVYFYNMRFRMVQTQEKFRCREGRKIG